MHPDTAQCGLRGYSVTRTSLIKYDDVITYTFWSGTSSSGSRPEMINIQEVHAYAMACISKWSVVLLPLVVPIGPVYATICAALYSKRVI